MPPTKKERGAVLSALAARRARQQAQASRSASRMARTSEHDQEDNSDHVDDSGLQVMIPPPTATQAISFRESAVSTVPSPSPTTRSSRSSTTHTAASIAASRPRRSSVTASAQPGLHQAEVTPRSARGSMARSLQTTPNRSTNAKVSSSSTVATPSSASKKRKSPRPSNRDGSDDELDQAVDDILAQLTFGQADNASDHDISASEQPPRKKRASQTAKTRSPIKARKETAVEAESSTKPKRAAGKPTPAARTTAKKPAARTMADSEVTPEKPKRAQPATRSSPSKAKRAASVTTKKLWTEDESRLQRIQRYFAGAAGRDGRTHVGPSALPVEDQATGFLAFGNDDEESDIASGVDDDGTDTEEGVQVEHVSGDSSDDQEQQDEGKAADTSMQLRKPRRSKLSEPDPRSIAEGSASDRAGTPPISIHNVDAGQTDEAQAADISLSREALLDAIPYSNFTPVLEGEYQNVVVIENKCERAKEALYFGLRHSETLVFLGIGHIQLLRGCAQIGGAILSKIERGVRAANLYAPICNPLPVLRSVAESDYFAQDQDTASASLHGEDVLDVPKIESVLLRNFDTVVKVTPFSSPITALGQVCPIGGLALPFSVPPNIELRKMHQLLTVKVLLAPDLDVLAQKHKHLGANGTFSTVGLSAMYIPNKWQTALHRLTTSALSAANHSQEESVVALVRGNKKVGKSTLSRMALERLLTAGHIIGGKVAYLELDLGQSDFGPPGMVALHVFDLGDNRQTYAPRDNDESMGEDLQTDRVATAVEAEAWRGDDTSSSGRNCIILGPGWCQPRVPVRAHFLGDVSPRDDPESYVAAVHDLIEYFRTEVQAGKAGTQGVQSRVPLVINTQGWVKGLGAELAARLERLLRPTHIYDVIPRGSPEPVPLPIRGPAWLDADGAILGSGPEIVTLESVSLLEFTQGVFAHGHSNGGANAVSSAAQLKGTSLDGNVKTRTGDGESTPPRYITDVGAKLAPAESRLLNLMSYLYATGLATHRLRGSSRISGTWDFSEPLVHRRPLVIDVCQGLLAGIRVLALGSSVPDSLKLMALNSSIVAIVVSDRGDVLGQQGDKEAADNEEATATFKQAFDRGARTLQAGLSFTTRCVGLGIVRSIDIASGHIHLLTPLHPAFLHELQTTAGCRIGLTKGALELPVWASLDFEAIKEARESRLNVAPATLPAAPFSATAQAEESGATAEPLLAGLPRNQVPYLEWPHTANALAKQKAKHATSNSVGSNGIASTPLQLGSEKRRVRRNLMRKSQFA